MLFSEKKFEIKIQKFDVYCILGFYFITTIKMLFEGCLSALLKKTSANNGESMNI